MKKYLTFYNKQVVKGSVTRRLFDTARLYAVKQALLDGLARTKQEKEALFNWAAKPIFADNFLWSILNKLFGIDLQVPFITGNWTTQAVKHNLVPTVGKKIVADQAGGTTTSPVTAIAIGIGSGGPAAGDTALNSEITTNGGERGAAAVTNQTDTTTGDTERWIKTFSFTGTFAVTEEGLLDNNAAGGLLLARQLFSAINVVSNDSLQITHNIKVTV